MADEQGISLAAAASDEPTGAVTPREPEAPANEAPASMRDGSLPTDSTDSPDGSRTKLADSGVPAVVPIAERLARVADMSDGSLDAEEIEAGLAAMESYDRVEPFSPAILAIRWSTTALSLALAAPGIAEGEPLQLLWGITVLWYSLLRSRYPIRYMGNIRSVAEVVAEAALHMLIVSTTGYWESPYVFTLVTAVTVAGFARGFGFALRIAGVSAVGVTIPFLTPQDAVTDDFLLSLRTSSVLLLIAVVSGWARRISGEAERQRALAVHRLDRLSDANSLLSNLHRVAQTLPASLDIDDVLETTVLRLRGLVDFDAVVVGAKDETDVGWDVLLSEGCRATPRLGPDEIPPPVARAVADDEVVFVHDHTAEDEIGFARRAASGLYAPLPARGEVIGFLALERTGQAPFTQRDERVVAGFAEPTGLAIDNARWFARLRTVGADEERTRIARDLHDRIGQSLAYLAFELDRIVSANQRGSQIDNDLDQLRSDVRGVIGEVRDTLYDLRTDVSEDNDLASTIEQYAGRIRERSGLDVDLLLDRRNRLPILQERELWRICQEAITNIERHAGASSVHIEWRCDGHSARLEISDDGVGFPEGHAGRLDSYGILGMRERAASIGATLEVTGNPGGGTTVRCTLVTPS
jgi:signal transduction histidine kinase